eukprot:7378189-Prymnesium_polylepis.1
MDDFQEPSALRDVAAFHRLFKVPVLSQPTIPDAKRSALRVRLLQARCAVGYAGNTLSHAHATRRALQEELDELKKAIEENDVVEVADALADLQYVLAGTVHEFGLGSRFGALHAEVHRSNMSKPCATREEAERTVAEYEAKGQPARIEEASRPRVASSTPRGLPSVRAIAVPHKARVTPRARQAPLWAWQDRENGVFFVYRISDNKALKSVQYSPPALEPILAADENVPPPS